VYEPQKLQTSLGISFILLKHSGQIKTPSSPQPRQVGGNSQSSVVRAIVCTLRRIGRDGMLFDSGFVEKLYGRPKYREYGKQNHQNQDDDQEIFKWSQVFKRTVSHAYSFNE
jgi:hypothetical protein